MHTQVIAVAYYIKSVSYISLLCALMLLIKFSGEEDEVTSHFRGI